jgi:transposase InsO family protein
MSRADYASEIHRRVQRPKQTRRVQVRGIDNTWTSDETGPIADPTKANRGYKYLLLVMDVFSRTATSILNKHVRS